MVNKMKNNIKITAFFENTKLICKRFGITPLMYGSLGLEYITDTDLCADDIDILIPNSFLRDRWNEFREFLETNEYALIDEHEHTFEKNGIHYSYAQIEELSCFADVPIEEIRTAKHDGVSFKLLTLHQYLKVYAASAKDGYRANVRDKKDAAKIEFINERLSTIGRG